MKLTTSKIAILAIAALSIFSLPGYAEAGERGLCPLDPRGVNAEPSRFAANKPQRSDESWLDEPAFNERSAGAIYARRNCVWCHGQSLQGFAIAPRLAGQHREYIEKQLRNIRNNTRNNPYTVKYMSHAAAKVSPQMASKLAAYFSSLPPEPANNGDEGLISRGKAVFAAGIPSGNVVACAFCHGPKAQGIGVIPRLGGQSYNYLKRRLEQWGQGYYVTADHMPGVASHLSPDQIEALASYLSFVK